MGVGGCTTGCRWVFEYVGLGGCMKVVWRGVGGCTTGCGWVYNRHGHFRDASELQK